MVALRFSTGRLCSPVQCLRAYFQRDVATRSPSERRLADKIRNRVITDLLFTCTTQTVATAVQLANRQRIWRYQYDATFPNLQLFPNAGAYHTAEIPSVWGTYPTTNEFGSVTPTQIALSSYMQGAWAGFAKNPSNGPGWPRLGSALGVELGALGSDEAPSGEKTVPLLQADYACALYDPILIAVNLAY